MRGLSRPEAGQRLLRSPPIVQLHDWYLVQELQNFKIARAVTHPADDVGNDDARALDSLERSAMQDLIAYVQTLR